MATQPVRGETAFTRRGDGNAYAVIFFGPGRFFLFFVLLFFLAPVLLYSPSVALLIAAIVLLVVLASGFATRRARTPESTDLRSEPSRPFAEVRSAAQDDLLALADDIRALDLDVELPGASAEAKAAYERALGYYEQARRAFDAAGAPEDFEPVSHAVEEGRFAIVTAKAHLEGREPPARRPPCFFDPRHGPSVRDVTWQPPGGTPRPVPACAADAIRIEEGETPAAREVIVRGRHVPYWEAPAYYGPWAGGFFGVGALSALLFGSALGAGLPVDPSEVEDGGGVFVLDDGFGTQD